LPFSSLHKHIHHLQQGKKLMDVRKISTSPLDEECVINVVDENG
jgi:hypothetical protein